MTTESASPATSVAANQPLTVLIADDAPDILKLLEFVLRRDNYRVIAAQNGREALDKFRSAHPDLAILDIMMPEMDGLELLKAMRAEEPDYIVVMMTADPRIPRVVEAMKAGAFDFLAKPFELNFLQVTIRQAADTVRLRRNMNSLREQLRSYEGFREVVAVSPAMKLAIRTLQQGIESNATVLLLGESGSGKSLLARELHRLGPRGKGPFVAVNCAAIPDQLLESELFGHERGAFTGAVQRRIGKFEAAQGGMIFLDEIAELSLPMQAKLLRVLQEREIVRVGSNTPIPLDVRVLAATNRDLEAAIVRNAFRQDLYYRLAVLEVHIPPLRERRDDIEPLAKVFLDAACKAENKRIKGFAPEAMELLMKFDYPGNIRPLENIVTRSVIVCEGEWVAASDLPPSLVTRLKEVKAAEQQVATVAAGSPLWEFKSEDEVPPLADVELAIMRKALNVCGGNMTKAAKRLQIGRATMYRRLFPQGLGVETSDTGTPATSPE